MTVIRQHKPWIIIYKQIFNEKKLSLQAIGLWALCMSIEEKEGIGLKDLKDRFVVDGIDLLEILDELIDAGYCQRSIAKDDDEEEQYSMFEVRQSNGGAS